MNNIKLYNVDSNYINYLSPHAPHLFLNKQKGQQNERKYIGIVLSIAIVNVLVVGTKHGLDDQAVVLAPLYAM